MVQKRRTYVTEHRLQNVELEMSTENDDLLIVTQNAADKVKTLIVEEGNDGLKLRICHRRWLFWFPVRLFV